MLDKAFNVMKGRHTAFAAAFFIVGNILQWLHKLDATYITFMTALMGFVIGHSIKDDLQARAMKNGDGNTPREQPPENK